MAAQDEKLNHLMRSVQAGRIVHALLFCGPSGTGKKTAAYQLAQSVFCTGTLKPCGNCPSCKQVAAKAHPDLHILKPDGKNIPVDDIRALIDKLALCPYQADRHITVIEDADTMTESAQNALLKTLENPANDVMFILTADSLSPILSTIQSRCRLLRFVPLSVAECTQILIEKGILPDRAALLSALAEGSVGRALEIDKDEKWFTLRENILRSLELHAKGRPIAELIATIHAQRGDERTVLDILQIWARDLMMLQNGGVPYEYPDLERLRKCRLSGDLMLQELIRTRKLLASNVAWSNCLSELLLNLK